MDNATLIRTFVEHIVTNQSIFSCSPDLRIEPASDSLQLVATSGGIVATSQLFSTQIQIAVRHQSSHWRAVHDILAQCGFLPTEKSQMTGFYSYKSITVPPDYHVRFSDALDILQAWWGYKSPGTVPSNAMLILHDDSWYAIEHLTCTQGTLTIHTLGATLKLFPLDRLLWLQQKSVSPPADTAVDASTNSLAPSSISSPNSEASTLPPPPPIMPRATARNRRLGHYLVEAGLLTSAQVEVVLCDQEATGMRFGDILVKRGWLKEQTIEFLMSNIVLPQRTAAGRRAAFAAQQLRKRLEQQQSQTKDSASILPAAVHSRETLVINRGPTQPEFKPTPQPVTSTDRHRLAASSQGPQFTPLSSLSEGKLHDRETLITHNKLDLEELQAWDEPETHDSERQMS